MSDRTMYTYLVFSSFSDSTLLSILLDTHPQMVCIDELENTFDRYSEAILREGYKCSCKMEIMQCEFWEKVKDCCLKSGLDFDIFAFDLFIAEDRPINISLRINDKKHNGEYDDRGLTRHLRYIPN